VPPPAPNSDAGPNGGSMKPPCRSSWPWSRTAGRTPPPRRRRPAARASKARPHLLLRNRARREAAPQPQTAATRVGLHRHGTPRARRGPPPRRRPRQARATPGNRSASTARDSVSVRTDPARRQGLRNHGAPMARPASSPGAGLAGLVEGRRHSCSATWREDRGPPCRVGKPEPCSLQGCARPRRRGRRPSSSPSRGLPCPVEAARASACRGSVVACARAAQTPRRPRRACPSRHGVGVALRFGVANPSTGSHGPVGRQAPLAPPACPARAPRARPPRPPSRPSPGCSAPAALTDDGQAAAARRGCLPTRRPGRTASPVVAPAARRSASAPPKAPLVPRVGGV
jgi:hypothetical protein